MNVIDDKTKWAVPHTGMDFFGRFQRSWMNVLFPRVSHRDVIEYLKKNTFDNTVFHYTSQRDVLFANNKHTLVTVHDSPFSQFKSSNYFNEKENMLQKMHTNYGRYIFEHNTMKSPYIATNTEYVKKALMKYGYRGNIETIYIPVSKVFRKLEGEDKGKLRKKLGLPVDKILLLSVSNKVLRKNLRLTEQLSQIMENEYKIVRVGDGIRNSINFKNIDDEKLNMIYNACDVLLFPSLEEGQGLPVIESFKAGLPVVASEIEVLKEVAGDAAIFIDPTDVESYYAGIKEAVSCREQLITKGNKMALRYTYEIFANKMEDLYMKIIKKL